MADVLKGLFGRSKPLETQGATADEDFADFAEAADPTPEPFAPVHGGANLDPNAPAATGLPYTKWYRLDERYSVRDFRAEGLILACILFIFGLHIFGSRMNKSKANKWIRAHSKILASEFSLVGFDNRARTTAKVGDGDSEDLAEPEKFLKEKSLFEYSTYATGRQNVAFMDAKLTLIRRFNPLMSAAEAVLSLIWESYSLTEDMVEVTVYPFDGKEDMLVAGIPGTNELRSKGGKSTYDGFVWAIVNKDRMKKVREERFDVSLTFTKDHQKLPNWLTVMSESAEITSLLLTPELAKAVETAGELLDFFIVSDQPTDRPKTLEETVPRKRIVLKYHLPPDDNYAPLLPIFQHAIRIIDQLARDAHFRPEVLKKVKNIRDQTARDIQKADLEEKSEERNYEREKAKKAKRDAELAALDAKGQKKYLEKEREKEQRRQHKKMTSRG